MKKQRIRVYDYKNNEWAKPNVLDVEAYCVGGTDGVKAVFEHDSFPADCVGIASGDDGHWWLLCVIHRTWLPELIDSLHAVLADTEKNK